MDEARAPDNPWAEQPGLSADRLRQLLDSLFVFAGLCTPEGILVEANHAALRAAGLTPEAVLGPPFEETWWWSFDPAVQARLREALDHAAAGAGSRYDTVVRLRDEEGVERQVEIDFQVIPILDDDGQVVHLVPSALEIGARKATERALRESEHRLRQALAAGQLGLWDYDFETERVRLDDRCRELLGVGEERPTLAGVLNRIHEADAAAVRQAVESVRSGDSAGGIEVEFRVRRPDDQVRWLAVQGQAEVAAGQPVRFYGAVRDITVWKQTMAALRDSEQRFRATFENAAVGIALVGLDGRFVRVNDAVCRATGYAAEELCGLTFQSLTHPDDLQGDLAQAEQLRRGEIDSYAMEKRYFRKDGTVVWINLSASLIRDPMGQPDHFIAVIEDISERRAAQEALVESEERFRNLADHSPVMVWVTDPDNQATYLNRGWLEFTGQSEAEAKGFGWLGAVHPADRADAERTLLAATSERQPFRLEYRLRRHDGEYRWALDVGAPRYGDSGHFLGYVGTVIDIMERRRQEEALRRADRQKDQFLAMLGHELRNPLAPIQNALTLLQGDRSADEAEQAVAVLGRQVDHLRRIVDDLLDVSRIGRGKVRLELTPLDLVELLAGAVADHRPEAEAKGLALVDELGDEEVWVEGDPTRLAQVLSNLLNNALKFTDRGGRIEVRLAREAEAAVVTVADTGVGLSPEILATLFDPFVQAEVPIDRAAGGLGLGLALVRGLIDAHEGEVSAVSDGPGRGTTFTIRLPLAEVGSTAEPAVPITEAERLRILVVEDNTDAAEMLAMLLAMHGHETRTAADAMAGLLALPAFRPQLILCDLGLPGDLDGFGFAAALRSDPSYADSYLVALTGYGRSEDRRQALSCGFDDHLTKPAGMTELNRVIQAAQAVN